jgi:uncharacterized protein YdeI (YjbR/CyaY-like superfamily)
VKPRFFKTPADFRAWMEKHHIDAAELLVGFYKTGSAKPSVTWPESVDVALCFGWIDGVRRRIDETSYTIRLTPRKPTGTWSVVNVRRVAELERSGLITPAGRKAFENRKAAKTGIYAYEQKSAAEFDPAFEKQFRAHKRAWDFFQSQAPWYRRTATHWVVRAKQPETRSRRLEQLIGVSEQGITLHQLTRSRSSRSASKSD